MKRRLLFTWSITIIIYGFSGVLNPLVAGTNAVIKHQSDTKIFLTTALSTLAEKHGVYFSYDVAVVKDIEVHFQNVSGLSIEQELKSLLKETALKFKKVGDKNYVIFQAPREEQKPKKSKISSTPIPTKKPIQELPVPSTDPTLPLPNKEELKTIEAPSLKVKGVVVDEKEEPMIGVNIRLKSDPGSGTVTSFDGTYALDIANENETLVFSYTGFQTQEIEVKGR